jgi:hypothetical protein
LAALIFAGTLVGTSSPAQAAATDPDAPATSAGRSTPITVRSATTEQIRAMAAQGAGKLITLSAPAAKRRDAGDGVAMAAAAVTCYLTIGVPYGGGAYNAHIFVDGLLYCDDYVHLAVLTLELFRGVDRVANTTATFPFVSGIYATAEYPTCNEGVYFGIVGATVARYDLTPPSVTANVVGYPRYIGCEPPPPPPPPAPLVVANPGNRRSLDGNPEQLQMTATGGTLPYIWSATGLPTGLSINSNTGLISGTTIRTGGFAVTVTAVDAANRSASTQFTWAVRRDACPTC